MLSRGSTAKTMTLQMVAARTWNSSLAAGSLALISVWGHNYIEWKSAFGFWSRRGSFWLSCNFREKLVVFWSCPAARSSFLQTFTGIADESDLGWTFSVLSILLNQGWVGCRPIWLWGQLRCWFCFLRSCLVYYIALHLIKFRTVRLLIN